MTDLEEIEKVKNFESTHENKTIILLIPEKLIIYGSPSLY